MRALEVQTRTRLLSVRPDAPLDQQVVPRPIAPVLLAEDKGDRHCRPQRKTDGTQMKKQCLTPASAVQVLTK